MRNDRTIQFRRRTDVPMDQANIITHITQDSNEHAHRKSVLDFCPGKYSFPSASDPIAATDQNAGEIALQYMGRQGRPLRVKVSSQLNPGVADVVVTTNVNDAGLDDEFAVMGTISTPISGTDIQRRARERVMKVWGVDLVMNSGKSVIHPGDIIYVNHVPILTQDNKPGVARMGDTSGKLMPSLHVLNYRNMQKVVTAMQESATAAIWPVVREYGDPADGSLIDLGKLDEAFKTMIDDDDLVKKLFSLVSGACSKVAMCNYRAKRLMVVFIAKAFVAALVKNIKFPAFVPPGPDAATDAEAEFEHNKRTNAQTSVIKNFVTPALILLLMTHAANHEHNNIWMNNLKDRHHTDIENLAKFAFLTSCAFSIHKNPEDISTEEKRRFDEMTASGNPDEAVAFYSERTTLHDTWQQYDHSLVLTEEASLQSDLILWVRHSVLGRALSRAAPGQYMSILVGQKI